MAIYSRNGDFGKTYLYNGNRVLKSADLVEVLGGFDELSSFLGLARLSLDGVYADKLSCIQNDLFLLGSIVAGVKFTKKYKEYLIKQVVWLEKEIDLMDRKLPPLKNFILPGGCESSARIHLARAICRRCERALVCLVSMLIWFLI